MATANANLGKTDREKELAQWEKGYRFEEFPKMLYRGRTEKGVVTVEHLIVANRQEQDEKAGIGWVEKSEDAYTQEMKEQEKLGEEAAERAGADRKMSAKAQAEAAAVDASTGAHVPSIPEGKKGK